MCHRKPRVFGIILLVHVGDRDQWRIFGTMHLNIDVHVDHSVFEAGEAIDGCVERRQLEQVGQYTRHSRDTKVRRSKEEEEEKIDSPCNLPGGLYSTAKQT